MELTSRVCDFEFHITPEEMAAFAALSGDRSLVHTDDDFARRHGFREAIVYGGILLAKLSHCLGSHLPGPRGVSMEWTIRYHSPLYVGETAVFHAEVKHVSEAVRAVEIAYSVTRDGRKIASGVAHSRLLGD
jgi:3-hydroxybutyryl-CoA dehydratase